MCFANIDFRVLVFCSINISEYMWNGCTGRRTNEYLTLQKSVSINDKIEKPFRKCFSKNLMFLGIWPCRGSIIIISVFFGEADVVDTIVWCF